MMSTAVLLIQPKFAHNVSMVLRACATFGTNTLRWTGERVPPMDEWPEGQRLPREERIKDYQHVDYRQTRDVRPITHFVKQGYTPVAIEVKESSENLIWFEHPEQALYVFGPEDGTLARGTLKACHRVVTIPTVGCMNLGVAASVVLYDRRLKLERQFDWSLTPVEQPLLRGGT
jgi:tRNA(Leu) C34 or U34 (ribose-2'-O)-methylase TrmL